MRSMSAPPGTLGPGWAWRKPRDRAGVEDSREPLTELTPPVTKFPRLVVQRLALRKSK